MHRQSRLPHLLAGVAGLGLVLGTPAFAQADADTAASGGIADIVVTARKRSENVQDVPIAITAMGTEEMQDRSIRDITDIAAATPSFFTQMSSADPSTLLVSMRGQSATDALLTMDSPIGVYVDGVYLPRQIGLRGAMVDIERVEVLRGPQGTLFGRNTTGGAVSITTRQPDLHEIGGYLSMVMGEHGRMESTGALNVPIVNDVFAVRGVVQYSNTNGFGRNAVGARVGGDLTKSGRLNAIIQPSDTLHISLSGDYQRIKGDGIMTRMAWINPFPQQPGSALPEPVNLLRATLAQQGLADTPANRAAAHSYLQSMVLGSGNHGFYNTPTNSPQMNGYEGYGVSGTITLDIGDYLSVKSITANRWAKRESLVDFDGTPITLWEPFYKTDTKVFSQELQLLSDPNQRFSWILGGYYSRETGDETSASLTLPPLLPTNPGITDGHVTNKSLAAFAQANYELTDSVSLTGGIRWTEETKTLLTRNRNGLGCNVPVDIRIDGACEGLLSDKYRDWSYLASIDWRASDDMLFYARTSRGFKGGGQNLRGQASDPRSFNPFDPETVTDYEIGTKLDLFDRRLRLNLAGYHAKYDNIQRSTSILLASGGASTLITNAAKAKINGAELEMTAQPVDNLTLNISGSYTHAKYNRFEDAVIGDRTGEAFPVPKWTLSTNISYALPTSIGDLKLIAGWNWRSATNLRPTATMSSTVTQPAYGIADVRVNMHIDSLGVDVAAFAKNLFDKEYIVGGVDLDRSLGYNIVNLGVPRIVGIEVRKSFGSR